MRRIRLIPETHNPNPRPLIAFWKELHAALTRLAGGVRKTRITKFLGRVGLADRMDHLPTELSGGEMQRVAIARALVNGPDLILADEPTGNLDSASGKGIIELFHQLNEEGVTVMMITHDEHIAAHAKRLVRIADGRIQTS